MSIFGSIAFRFWVTFNFLSIVAILSVGGLYLWSETNKLEDALRSEAQTAATTLNSAIGLSMLQEDYSQISPHAYSLLDQPNVQYVIIRDEYGNVVNQKGETLNTNNEIIVEKIPISYFQKYLGEIEIALQTIVLKEQRADLYLYILFTSFIATIISVLLSFFLAKN